jgi:hypothetical protein
LIGVVAAYRADIEIGIRGQRELERLRSSITQTTQAFESLNRVAAQRGALRQTLTNYETQLNRAARAINNVTLGSQAETKAIREYVTAMGAANAARSRQNFLIAQEVANRRRVIATANAGFGVQGPALPSTRTAARSGGSNTGNAISSAIIGGGFPLLFGQGPGAAAGGALGGLAGGLLGGGFGFALSIAGTAIGDLITKSEALDKSLASLNSSLSSTGSTSVTTAADVSRLASNLRITNEEAVELLGTFSQFGDANIREAVASLFGGVGGASTFEAIARAGIDEKNALSSVFQLRQLIGNEAATQLALQLNTVGATQTQAALLKLVVERSIQSSVAASKQVQFTDNLLSIWENIVAGVATALSLATQFIKKMQEGQLIQLPFLDQVIQILGGGTKARTGKQIADERGAALEKTLRDQIKAVRDAVQQETGVLSTQTTLAEAFKPQKKDRAAEEAAREAARVAEVVRARQLATIELQRQAVFSREIAQAEMDKDPILVRQLQGQQELMRLGIQTAAELEKEQNGMAQLAIAREAQAKKALILLGIELDIAKIQKEQQLQIETLVEDLDQELALKYAITEQERTQLRIAYEMARLRKSMPFMTDADAALLQQGKERLAAPKTGSEIVLAEIGMLQDELTKLNDLGNVAVGVAEGIGSAFATSFKGIVSGSMTAREALASFFQSVADQFLDMAAQIIAKWIQMTILNSILKLFPGGSTPLGFGGASDPLGAGGAFWNANANGNAFGANGIVPFAKGGIVNSPTLFPFAKGIGLMGEAGPEAIMPLRRGADGKLGVMAAGGGGEINVVVNVDASGSSVEGNEQEGQQLGRVIAAAMQAELIKQKRPGGLLA